MSLPVLYVLILPTLMVLQSKFQPEVGPLSCYAEFSGFYRIQKVPLYQFRSIIFASMKLFSINKIIYFWLNQLKIYCKYTGLTIKRHIIHHVLQYALYWLFP